MATKMHIVHTSIQSKWLLVCFNQEWDLSRSNSMICWHYIHNLYEKIKKKNSSCKKKKKILSAFLQLLPMIPVCSSISMYLLWYAPQLVMFQQWSILHIRWGFRALSRYFGKIGAKLGKNYRQNTKIGNTVLSEQCQDDEVLLIIDLWIW